MEINVNQMRKKPFRVPTILLWVLNFQISAKYEIFYAGACINPKVLLALGSIGELLQHVVQHGGQAVRQLWLEEGSLDVLGEIVEHVYSLSRQSEV